MNEILITTAEDATQIRQPEQSLIERQNIQRKIISLIGNISCPQNHQHLVLVLDMDGTLYPHDGPGNGFKGSSVERSMMQIHRNFIRANESGLNDGEVNALLQESLQHPVGPSMFFSERYNRSRAHTFELIWDPLQTDACIPLNAAVPVRQVLGDIRSRTCAMMLLTGAPAIWQKKVFQHLNIKNDSFDAVITTEEFTSKAEVFNQIAGIQPAVRGISIGDSESTDIIPAGNAGLQTLHMNHRTTLKDVPHFLKSHHG